MNYVDIDYEPLTLSDDEMRVLYELHSLSNQNDYEYGLWYSEEKGFSEIFTSYEKNRIVIPAEAYNEKDICLYHSHTNATYFSDRDYYLLLDGSVKRIVLITSESYVLTAEINGGDVPTPDEYWKFVSGLKSEVDLYMIEKPGFYDWSEKQRFLEAAHEEAFRIARNYKWRLEGGTL